MPTRTMLLIAVSLVVTMASGCETEIEAEHQAVTDDTASKLTSYEGDSESSMAAGLGMFCNDCQLVDVTGVVDGDTIDTSVGRVRFFGVNTPEKGKQCFREATDFTRTATGSKVRLEYGPRRTDKYDRRLAYVYESSGDSIDAQLIESGFAVAWTRDGQHRDYLVSLEENARKTRTGCLWK